MSPKNMHVCSLLVVFLVIPILADEIDPRFSVSGTYSKFWDKIEETNRGGNIYTIDNSKDYFELIKNHFDHSMDYLLNSKQYGSQYAQRPGMAKYLNEASNRHWEEGMDNLKKFLQRGGRTNNNFFKRAFTIEGTMLDLGMSANGVLHSAFNITLGGLLDDSKMLTKSMNHLHHLASRTYQKGGDFEMAHFFDSKLKKEAEITRELAGYINVLYRMKDSSIALNMFDSNL